MVPVFDIVDMKISARYTDVEDIGSDSTYKIGLTWNITEDLKLRTSRGTSFRTPSLFELYLADQSDFTGQRNLDPCVEWQAGLDAGTTSQKVATNCAADGIAGDFGGGSIDATVITGGGLGVLSPETSVAITVGLVWTPNFGDHCLSVSLDYFNFFIKNEVATLTAGSIVSGCYDSDFFPNDGLCDQFFRIDTVSASFLNINSQENIGYDLGLNYEMALGFGVLRLESRSTYQEKDEVGLFEGTVEDHNGDIGEPKLTSTFNAALSMDDWTYNWKVNYVGKACNFREDGGNTVSYRGTVYNVINTVDSYHTHTFSTAYNFSDSLNLIIGVANAFDEEPPYLSYQPNSLAQSDLTGGGNAAYFSQYNFIGRRYFANATYNF